MMTTKFKGKEIKLKGSFPKVGDKAPIFTLVARDLKEIDLNEFSGKKKLLNIFPSMDTSVCAKSVRAFHETCEKLTDLVVLNISMDLPFAAGRFCEGEGMANAVTLSAFRSSFPDDYGVKINEGPLKGLCARAVIVLDENNRVEYCELVSEMTQEPDYSSVLATVS
jgi:thiol peroxidase